MKFKFFSSPARQTSHTHTILSLSSSTLSIILPNSFRASAKIWERKPRWIIDTKWPFPFINKREKTASISRHHKWCSPWNDVWAMTAEIQHWWPITSQIWGVLPLGGGKFLSRHNQSEAVSRSPKIQRNWFIKKPKFSPTKRLWLNTHQSAFHHLFQPHQCTQI